MATVAIIGGTGLSAFCQGDITGVRETPYGKTSADILQGTFKGKSFYFLARHGNPHIIPPHKVNYRANLHALKLLGVTHVIAVNAVGSIDSSLLPGSLVIPDQLIDYTYDREHTFSDSADVPLEHIDFSSPFSPGLRCLILEEAAAADIPVKATSVYAVMQGPRLETAAEIDRLERDGANIVGMTAMPEAGLARELNMDYASISLVVNPAAGRSDEPITMEAIHQVLDQGMDTIKSLLEQVVANRF